ncbi:concanavalin A-like lectin/glucanase domain-containing protein [Suillus discolor]|uniref:Concanavalin A-like lectin/glucanase domain-containing protein n=1 Tax=Suillus discolor TaxID=1912936 RepID=A0A9P7F294_9AGAM|nr:concanavalin A-like lectin/glucanase domain-containing protein [Suillus discolor]KAG2104106.1 concanavalin A-like lectin/glucanase domain-containing protein [Suillus discolor]
MIRYFSVCYLAYILFTSLPCVLGKTDTTVNNKTIDRTIQLRTHSIFPPYIDQDLQNRWWDFGADAYINTNKHIRLARARPSQMGWLWSRMPVTGESTHLYGDGMAIWLTKDRAEPGPVFGSKGQFYYANSRHPYGFPRVISMLGDGQTPYDQAHDGEANSLGSCSANFRRTNVITKLKITYVKDTYLDVKVHYRAWDDWSDCFRLTGISLPPAPYIGITAMTGEVFDSHDVISVTTWSAILSASDAQRNKFGASGKGTFSRKSGAESQGGSWLGFIFKILLFVAVCAGASYGYKTYTLNKRRGYGGSAFGGLGYESRRRF